MGPWHVARVNTTKTRAGAVAAHALAGPREGPGRDAGVAGHGAARDARGPFFGRAWVKDDSLVTGSHTRTPRPWVTDDNIQ